MAPQDWLTTQLGNVATLQRGFDLPTRLRRRGTVPIVSSSGVSGWHDHAMVQAPGVVTGRYGTIGEVFLQLQDFWPLNTTLWVSNFHGNDETFIYYLLQRVDFSTHSGKSGVPGVNRNDLHTELVSIPTDVKEQRRIADALSDADSLIVALERLIAKKRAIKQGMTQQLITGRMRLPGFSGERQERRLADVAVKIQDGTHFSPKSGGSAFKYITSKNIGFGEMRLDVVETISEFEHRKIYSRCDTKFGDLLITKDGANTGNAALNPFHEEISLLSSVAFVRCNPRLATESYILQYILSDRGQQQVRDAMAGNAITRLTLAKIRDLVIPMPSVDEQHAIAQVLCDADAEIAAARARLNKAREIKQGMMQQLLAGRTRLPVQEAA
jgi:type I restriction enzyme, S subunit